MATIKINYMGKEKEFEKGVLLKEILEDYKEEYKYDVLVGSINNRLVSLDSKVTKDCNIDFFDYSSLVGNTSYEKGVLFLLCKAVRDVLNCDVKILHTMEKGIYCEILTNNLISEVTIEKIKIRMKELVEAELPITKIMVSRIDAIDYYKKVNQIDKANSLRYISNSSVSLYKMDDYLDYFYGVLPNNTKLLDKFNIKFLHDNKIIIMTPWLYDLNLELKYNKNEKLLKALESNDEYLNCLNIGTSVDLNNAISTGNYEELIRLNETMQNNRLFDIADKISKNKDLKIILITGPSSSGKTTTSKKLKLYLKGKGLKPLTISVDDFFLDLDKRPLGKDGKPVMESIDAVDTNHFNLKISELLDGKEVYLPKYDFVTSKQILQDCKTKMTENSVLIIEGLHAFNEKLTEMIPDKNKFKIYICPLTPLNIDNHNMFRWDDNRFLRRLVRDNKTRNVSASKTLEHWKNVRNSEEENIIPYMNEADEIFNTSLLYELGVLKTYAEPLLFSVKEDDPNYYEAIRLTNLFRLILGMPSDSVPNDSLIREFIGGSCFKD